MWYLAIHIDGVDIADTDKQIHKVPMVNSVCHFLQHGHQLVCESLPPANPKLALKGDL
jgi:hypothetical protein